MGGFLSTIRGWYYSNNDCPTIANTSKLEDDAERKASRNPTAVVTYSNEEKEGRLSPRTPITNYIAGESIQKELKGVSYENFEAVVERLSTRYNISDDAKKRILDVKRNESLFGEVRFEDDKCCVVVVKREDELDIFLSCASITTYTADDYVR